MGIRDVITVGALIFGICSWAVLLGGLATVHGTIADSAKTLEEFNTFSFSWFLVCGFLWSWVVTMVCYLVGIMPSAAKFMTPILSILIAWFGVEIQKVLAWVLKAHELNWMEGKSLIWAVGTIACSIALAIMVLLLSTWEDPKLQRVVKEHRHTSGNSVPFLNVFGADETSLSQGESGRQAVTPYGRASMQAEGTDMAHSQDTVGGEEVTFKLGSTNKL